MRPPEGQGRRAEGVANPAALNPAAMVRMEITPAWLTVRARAPVFRAPYLPVRLAQVTGMVQHLFTQLHGYTLEAVALALPLLPFCGRRKSPTRTGRATGAAASRRKATALLVGALLPAVVACVLPPAGPAEAGGRRAANLAAPGGYPNPEGRPPIEGWITCGRPDGLYLFPLGKGAPVKLVGKGGYPRWSPDGRRIAYLSGGSVMVMNADGSSPRKLAGTGDPRAVGFSPDGAEVLFTDGKRLRAVSLDTGAKRLVASGHDFRELDLGPRGRLAVTVKDLGFSIRALDLVAGTERKLASGCSASLSPDGALVTVNSGDHRSLALLDWETGAVRGGVKAPGGLGFDNHFWSNHPDWIVSQTEGATRDALVHHVPSGRAWRITGVGDCDRPDLFVGSPPRPPAGD